MKSHYVSVMLLNYIFTEPDFLVPSFVKKFVTSASYFSLTFYCVGADVNFAPQARKPDKWHMKKK